MFAHIWFVLAVLLSGPQPSTGDRIPQLTTEIVGEICWTAADPSVGIIMTMVSAPDGAVTPVGEAPGGLIALKIAPVNAEAEIEPDGVSVPEVTVRTPSTKVIV